MYAGHAGIALYAKSRAQRVPIALLVPVAFAPDWIQWTLIAFGLGLALTAGSLAALSPAHPGRLAEVGVLLAANLVATVIRFLLYRHWVFRRPERPPDPWPVTSTVQRNDMATQGERTT